MRYKRIAEITDVITGGTPATSNHEYWDGGTIPWLQSGCCQNCDVTFAEKYITQSGYDNSSTKMMVPDTVMIALTGATAGKVGYLTFAACGNQSITGILPSTSYNSRFLFFYLLSRREQILADCIGGAQPHISQGYVKDILVPDISLEEQKRIVDEMECISSILNKRQEEIKLFDKLIKARFVELYGNPVRNEKGWLTYKLEECLDRIDNGKSFVCSDKPRTGINPAVLKLSAATYGDYRPDENKALLDDGLFVEGAEVQKGDLLFTRKNTPELVGMAAYVYETPPRLMMPDLIFRLIPNNKMNAIFLWQLINCQEFRPVIKSVSGGSAKSMSNISKERLGKISVICPPRELQDELVPFIEQVNKSKVVVKKALEESQMLFDSLMQEYFG